LSRIPVQRDRCGTLHQCPGQSFGLRHAFGTSEHQNKK
jgi:hypothetical protein